MTFRVNKCFKSPFLLNISKYKPFSKKYQKVWATCIICKQFIKVKSRPNGENSPKRRKFAQSGHPDDSGAYRTSYINESVTEANE
jgi:hypothetical protein